MGKPTGFLEYERKTSEAEKPKDRIKHFNEFHTHLSMEEQQKQGARCMECGVPFCQAGMTIAGMTSGCPLHNLVPEWNDLVYEGNWERAYNRLVKTNNFPEFTSRVVRHYVKMLVLVDSTVHRLLPRRMNMPLSKMHMQQDLQLQSHQRYVPISV